MSTELHPQEGVFIDPQPRFENKPSQTLEGQLQGSGHVPAHDAQLQSIIDHHGIEGGLDHFRNVEVIYDLFRIRESETRAEILVILQKWPRRA